MNYKNILSADYADYETLEILSLNEGAYSK